MQAQDTVELYNYDLVYGTFINQHKNIFFIHHFVEVELKKILLYFL